MGYRGAGISQVFLEHLLFQHRGEQHVQIFLALLSRVKGGAEVLSGSCRVCSVHIRQQGRPESKVAFGTKGACLKSRNTDQVQRRKGAVVAGADARDSAGVWQPARPSVPLSVWTRCGIFDTASAHIWLFRPRRRPPVNTSSVYRHWNRLLHSPSLQKHTRMFWFQRLSVCTSIDKPVAFTAALKSLYMFLEKGVCCTLWLFCSFLRHFYISNAPVVSLLSYRVTVLHCKRIISISAINPTVRPLCPPTVMHFHPPTVMHLHFWSVLWKEAVSVIFLSCCAVHHSGGGQYRQREAGHL